MQTLHQLWDRYVKTPVTPLLTLESVATTPCGQGWLSIQADVAMDVPQPQPAPS